MATRRGCQPGPDAQKKNSGAIFFTPRVFSLVDRKAQAAPVTAVLLIGGRFGPGVMGFPK